MPPSGERTKVEFKLDDIVQIISTTGEFRYGYVNDIMSEGFEISVCLSEEGASKIEFDAATGVGMPVTEIWDKVLSEAERRVIPLLGSGKSPKEIAESLKISPITVRSHFRILRLKLKLDNNEQLTAFAEGLNLFLSIKEDINGK